ncbi:hypothetical protein FNV43_RR23883 [Rhamnella rubrinervis]|uniref:Protein yippee-like n=1 Tax=Rhamnella rubrinervis TaxID=2594499 RepID=A0A8K0DQ42_9ROSA|nr:hypothetical protein FNV43_RR23883 [Rhamnella rubrinervis]
MTVCSPSGKAQNWTPLALILARKSPPLQFSAIGFSFLNRQPARGSAHLLRAHFIDLTVRLYSCCNCRNHVSLHDDIISKAFQGRNGRAFLFSHAMNIVVGPKEDRHLLTGLHTVADVHCSDCREVLGWKYERAYEASQKYKEGKFILEKSKIVKENW